MPIIQSPDPLTFLRACDKQSYRVSTIFIDFPFQPLDADSELAYEDHWKAMEAICRRITAAGGWVITPFMPYALPLMLDIWSRWGQMEQMVIDLHIAAGESPWLHASHQYVFAWGKDINSKCEVPRSSVVVDRNAALVPYLSADSIVLEPNGNNFKYLDGQVKFYLGSTK